MKSCSIYSILSWSSHKNLRPERSISAAEILAAGEAIDEGKMLARTVSSIYNTRIPLVISLDSRDLCTSLSTQRNSVDKSIRCDVNVICHEFDRRNVAKFVGIAGDQKLADPGTKSDSSLMDALRCCM